MLKRSKVLARRAPSTGARFGARRERLKPMGWPVNALVAGGCTEGAAGFSDRKPATAGDRLRTDCRWRVLSCNLRADVPMISAGGFFMVVQVKAHEWGGVPLHPDGVR
ncbi:hypothetical protein GCM10010218_23530 [Streptomyces mashuensis]|uniref:Uncharacterized protein n=1 Tax=Streptomyces mashuensis TaxID=33904 RepID=A0A919B3A0_9ACTN|nr:hypothetical protein GCM10010218_23530 [Streptomyces mashuensis]